MSCLKCNQEATEYCCNCGEVFYCKTCSSDNVLYEEVTMRCFCVDCVAISTTGSVYLVAEDAIIDVFH